MNAKLDKCIVTHFKFILVVAIHMFKIPIDRCELIFADFPVNSPLILVTFDAVPVFYSLKLVSVSNDVPLQTHENVTCKISLKLLAFCHIQFVII